MSTRTLTLSAAACLLTACASGMKQAPAPLVPNLEVPADLLSSDPAPLPALTDPTPSGMLATHVQGAQQYHALAIDFRSLVCAITGQRGYTVNGAAPVRPTWCETHEAATSAPTAPDVAR